MIKLNVNLGTRGYPIHIATDYGGLDKAVTAAGISGKMVLITDSNVDKYQAQECMDVLLSNGYNVSKHVIEAGEKSKNLDTVRKIYEHLVSLKLDRSASLIALGGGVTGDITGFVASTFLRGINFIQVPTTLLAQADSSVGGKVGVDFMGNKNIVGTFYQPKFVYLNVNSLKTLPKRELQSGLAEVVKHGIITDSDFYEYVDYNVNRIFLYDKKVLQYISKMNCSIKGSVVEQDEKESGLRAILNFGHTIGHAVESVSDFELLHGECVSIGMVGAFKLAQYLGMVNEQETAKITTTLEKIGLPVRASGFDEEHVYNQMFFDKKVKGGKLVFVLPKAIGSVIQCVVDDEELIRRVLKELLA